MIKIREFAFYFFYLFTNDYLFLYSAGNHDQCFAQVQLFQFFTNGSF